MSLIAPELADGFFTTIATWETPLYCILLAKMNSSLVYLKMSLYNLPFSNSILLDMEF